MTILNQSISYDILPYKICLFCQVHIVHQYMLQWYFTKDIRNISAQVDIARPETSYFTSLELSDHRLFYTHDDSESRHVIILSHHISSYLILIISCHISEYFHQITFISIKPLSPNNFHFHHTTLSFTLSLIFCGGHNCC